jgi:transcription antitermination factor NusA-like protein
MEINMQTIRYINLLDKASRVKTTKCFLYNNAIIFAVPKNQVSKAIGPDATNIKAMQQKLGKKIRIIQEPTGITDLEGFVSDIVYPVKFKSATVQDNMVVISSGGTQNKANLIGRNKIRMIELKKIIDDVFRLELKII